MPPQLWKYYLRTTLIPAAISLLGVIVFLALDSGGSPVTIFKNAITGTGIESLVLGLAGLNALLFAVFAATLFFNRYTRVRRKAIYRLFAWFFVPLTYLSAIAITSDETDYETLAVIGCATLPYVVGLIITFRQFDRKLKVAEPHLVHQIAPLID